MKRMARIAGFQFPGIPDIKWKKRFFLRAPVTMFVQSHEGFQPRPGTTENQRALLRVVSNVQSRIAQAAQTAGDRKKVMFSPPTAMNGNRLSWLAPLSVRQF